MSAWVHCNRCCAMAVNGATFWLTSCGHIVCESCLKMAGAMPGQKGSCIVCKKPDTGIMKINRSMRPDMLAMFRPSKDTVAECNRNLNTVIGFQAMQSQRLIKQLYEKLTETTKFAHAAQAEMKKRGERVQLLESERNQHIAELEKGKECVHQLENCLAEREQEIQRLKHQQHKSPGRLGTQQHKSPGRLGTQQHKSPGRLGTPHKKDYRFPSLGDDASQTSPRFFRRATHPYQNPFTTADIFPGSRHPFLGSTPQPNLNLQNLLDTPTASSINTNAAPMMIAPDPTPNFYSSASQMMGRTPAMDRYF